MQAVRKIQIVKNGEVNVQLPQQFWGQEVEIIVMPTSPMAIPTKQSLRGSLKSYSRPELIAQESDAWLAEVAAKHESR